ncbi:hypothetical protein H8K35_08400 [Undibacterium sp. LX40W]|uniref:Uncharacterized protein n=1 Tax=Undibacterium nitidum TaxID=2762298 RepID=A0A923HKX5_9BURK|nr:MULTISPECIES: hypothetical protein [Undibacterium]MBC3881545.1 hypothetical protein [Undibacterium nitidum]MBC3891673.1 hypothetical protein [Undibacterium sp. LX40W]
MKYFLGAIFEVSDVTDSTDTDRLALVGLIQIKFGNMRGIVKGGAIYTNLILMAQRGHAQTHQAYKKCLPHQR